MIKESIVEFCFEFTDCNGRMKLYNRGFELFPDKTGRLIVRENIQWPSVKEFELKGKDKFGTLLDSQGNIINDRAIKILWIKIDELIPDTNFLKRWPTLIVGDRHSNQIINSDYFGFNGLVKFEFSAKSPLHFMIKSNQFRDNFWKNY